MTSVIIDKISIELLKIYFLIILLGVTQKLAKINACKIQVFLVDTINSRLKVFDFQLNLSGSQPFNYLSVHKDGMGTQ